MILAHQTAAYTRAKKMPDLARILEKMDRRADGAPRKAMAWEDMRAALMTLRRRQKKG